MVTRSDYPEPEVQACISVLLEIFTALGEYREHMVVVGGNVPPLLIKDSERKHPGTLDVDIALDFEHISSNSYQAILEILCNRGYYQKNANQPNMFYKDVDDGSGNYITVRVDLLAGEYGGTGKGHRHQRVQEVLARKCRGCDLVFSNSIQLNIEGTLPGGAINTVPVKIPSAGCFLVTKGFALWERMKEKDAFDIYFCCKYYPGGITALADEMKTLVSNELVREGLGKIKAKFAGVNSIGPSWVADFDNVTEQDERDLIKREAYELINGLMDDLGIESFSE